MMRIFYSHPGVVVYMVRLRVILVPGGCGLAKWYYLVYFMSVQAEDVPPFTEFMIVVGTFLFCVVGLAKFIVGFQSSGCVCVGGGGWGECTLVGIYFKHSTVTSVQGLCGTPVYLGHLVESQLEAN